MGISYSSFGSHRNEGCQQAGWNLYPLERVSGGQEPPGDVAADVSTGSKAPGLDGCGANFKE